MQSKPTLPLETVNFFDDESKSRFWKWVTKTEGCWEWNGFRDKKFGYGSLSRRRFSKTYSLTSHRFSWVIHYGHINIGICVLHKCDNPACVRPDHLFLGTQLDNGKDCASKNRTMHGERHTHAKLTEGQILEIREMKRKGEKTSTLSFLFNVSTRHINNIALGRFWSRVPV